MFTDLLAGFIFVVFAVVMVGLLIILHRARADTREGFYVADRKVGIFSGGISLAVTWVWAPALFVASSIAYDLGLPGALWFIVPNVACFFIFAPIAFRFRKMVAEGYTLPGFFRARFPNHNGIPIAFAVTTLLFAMAAIVENLVAISKLYNFYTGSPGWIAIVAMTVIALGYSLMSGLKASILTDVLQMLLVIVVGLILVPWAFGASGTDAKLDLETLSGASGDVSWLAVAFAPGLSLLFGLIGGPLGDQMFFQRAMAVKTEDIKKTMYTAGAVFAIVPIALSAFGFLGVALGDSIQVTDSELVGAVIVQQYLPFGASILFFVMMLCGLASTLDSAFCAGSAIGGRDIFAQLIPDISERTEITASRATMVVIAIIGALLASVSRDIWFVFMTDASIAAAGIVPVILSVYWKRQTSQGTFWSLVAGVIAGCFISIAGHFYGAHTLAALGAPLAVAIGLAISLLLSAKPHEDLEAQAV